MNNQQLNRWLKKFKKAWEERNPQVAADLFAQNVKYYESVLEKPHLGQKEVLKLWSVVPQNQKKYQIYL